MLRCADRLLPAGVYIGERSNRALRLYGERVHFIEIYSEQLRRWRNENPDAKQRREIERLETQTSRLRELNAHVLRLAAEIRKGTISRVMEKSDLELGLEALARYAKDAAKN